jgi:hypothetical protein
LMLEKNHFIRPKIGDIIRNPSKLHLFYIVLKILLINVNYTVTSN